MNTAVLEVKEHLKIVIFVLCRKYLCLEEWRTVI